MGGRGGRNVAGVVRLDRGARSWALRAVNLVLLSLPIKSRNVNCEQGCKGKLIQKKSILSGRSGVPSHKCTKGHNNSISENLLLEQKVRN